MYLLEFICKRNPHVKSQYKPEIHLSCVCNPSGHSVSSRGFLLLEEIEAEFGSHLQPILKIQIDHMHDVDLLSALSARAQRCPDVIQKMEVHTVWCRSLNFAKLFLNLLQRVGRVAARCSLPTGDPSELAVFGEVGGEAWEVLGAALSLHPGVFKVVATFKETLLRARREDLQKIHLALNTWKKWNVKEKGAEKCILHNSMLCSERMYNYTGDRGHRGRAERKEDSLEWGRLEDFLDKQTREEGLG